MRPTISPEAGGGAGGGDIPSASPAESCVAFLLKQRAFHHQRKQQESGQPQTLVAPGAQGQPLILEAQGRKLVDVAATAVCIITAVCGNKNIAGPTLVLVNICLISVEFRSATKK